MGNLVDMHSDSKRGRIDIEDGRKEAFIELAMFDFKKERMEFVKLQRRLYGTEVDIDIDIESLTLFGCFRGRKQSLFGVFRGLE